MAIWPRAHDIYPISRSSGGTGSTATERALGDDEGIVAESQMTPTAANALRCVVDHFPVVGMLDPMAV